VEATRRARSSVGVQVKTNQNSVRSWILNERVERIISEDLFYVFVNLNGVSVQPTYHVVPSEIVATYTRTSHAEWLAGVGRGGRTRKDSPMRRFSDFAMTHIRNTP
jgi:hypothetical protein